MTFEEYCNENDIDYDKIIDVLDNADEEIVYKCSDYYRIEDLWFRTTNNKDNNNDEDDDEDESSDHEEDTYQLCIDLNNFKVRLWREVKDWS